MADREDLVFNTKGHSFSFDIDDRKKYLIIKGLGYSSTVMNEKLKTLGESQVIPPITGNPEESGPITSKDKRFLIIGLTLADPKFDWNKMEVGFKAPPPPQPVKKTRRATAAAPQTVDLVDTSGGLYRVGVEITSQSTNMLKFAVFLHQEESGLCWGNCLSGKGPSRVFFFSEFRTNATAINKRETEWSALVRTHISSILEKEAGMMEAEMGKVSLKKSKDPTVALLPRRTTFANELSLLVSRLSISPNPETLKELKNLLVSEDHELKLPMTQAIQSFLDYEEDIDTETAEQVAKEVEGMWEDVKVDLATVMFLKKGLQECKITVEMKYLRGFLAEGHYGLQNGLIGTVNAAAVTENLYKTVCRIIGDTTPKPRTSIQSDQWYALLTAIIGKLERIATASRTLVDDLRDVVGDQVTDLSLADIVATYAAAIDKDTAKFAFNLGMREVAGRIAEGMDMTGESIEELVEQLKQLQA